MEWGEAETKSGASKHIILADNNLPTLSWQDLTHNCLGKIALTIISQDSAQTVLTMFDLELSWHNCAQTVLTRLYPQLSWQYCAHNYLDRIVPWRTDRKAQKAVEDQICNLTVQRQQFEGLLHVAEEKLVHEQARSQEIQQKLQRAEAELTELRCFLKVLATNEQKIKKFGAERTGIIDELQNIGGKIDRVQRVVSQQLDVSPRRSPVRRRPIQTWRGSSRL
jgi:hypothetical protein